MRTQITFYEKIRLAKEISDMNSDFTLLKTAYDKDHNKFEIALLKYLDAVSLQIIDKNIFLEILKKYDGSGKNILHIISRNPNPDLLEIFLRNVNEDFIDILLLEKTRSNWTVLHTAAGNKGCSQNFRVLFDLSSKIRIQEPLINHKNQLGQNILHVGAFASSFNRDFSIFFELLSFIVEKNLLALISEKDGDGCNVFHIVTNNIEGNVDVAIYMIRFLMRKFSESQVAIIDIIAQMLVAKNNEGKASIDEFDEYNINKIPFVIREKIAELELEEITAQSVADSIIVVNRADPLYEESMYRNTTNVLELLIKGANPSFKTNTLCATSYSAPGNTGALIVMVHKLRDALKASSDPQTLVKKFFTESQELLNDIYQDISTEITEEQGSSKISEEDVIGKILQAAIRAKIPVLPFEEFMALSYVDSAAAEFLDPDAKSLEETHPELLDLLGV